MHRSGRIGGAACAPQISGAAAEAGERILRQNLRVVALDGEEVVLAGARASGCGQCGVRDGCGAAALAGMIGGEEHLRLPRTLPLAVGDEVVVAMTGDAFLGAALRAYLLPPAALAGAAALAATLGFSDGATAALCLPALALALWPLARAERCARNRPVLRIEGRVSKGPCP